MLTTPLRRLKEDPAKLLPAYARKGMVVLEPGPGMGFFTLELARLVGPAGRVIAVDLQEKMLAGLRRRAERSALSDRIETRLCTADDLAVADLAGAIDLAVLWHMVHEVARPGPFFAAVYACLRPGALALLVEPRGHVAEADFHASVARAIEAGFEVAEPVQGKNLRVVLRRPVPAR